MIINLTQHLATPAQKAAGVVDLPTCKREQLCKLLDFLAIPSPAEITERANAIVALAIFNGLNDTGDDEVDNVTDDPHPASAMIGGAPFLMGCLERYLRDHGIAPRYAFSLRESNERVLPDGSVEKTNVFKHVGFIHAPIV